MTDLVSPGSAMAAYSIGVTVRAGYWSKAALYVIGDLAWIFTDVITHPRRYLVL
jgi:hypothetical protein